MADPRIPLPGPVTHIPAGRRAAWLRTGWAGFAARRLVGLALSLALLAIGAFLIVPLIPGEPAVAILGPNATRESIEALRERLGLNEPISTQFAHYVSGLFHGDLGTSYRYRIPVTQIIAAKFPYTAPLALTAIAIVLIAAIILGMTVGVLTRGGRRRALGTVFGTVAGFFAALPSYVTGALLVMLCAITWKLFPAGGADAPGVLVLPITALALGPTFAVARLVRQETHQVLQQEFMRTARGHRLPTARIYLVHVLPNLLTSTLTLAGLVLSSLVGGAVVIETVVNYPGLGLEEVQAIIYKDYPVIQGIILVIGSLAIAINLLIDVILGLIDPRTLGGRGNG